MRAVVLGYNNRAANLQGAIQDDGYNLSADNTPAFTGTTSANQVDPKLGPFGNYGGPTQTLPLLLGSPAIDRVADNNAPATDQRLRLRPWGAHPDSGAFESSPSFRIFGQLHGVVPAGTTINSTIAPDANGRFALDVLPGPNTITIAAANTVFRPSPATLDVQADMLFDARGFALRQFGWDPDQPSPTYTFAGAAGETWDFFASNDLIDWRPAGSQTFPGDSLHSIDLAPLGNPVFLKTTRR